MSSEWTVPPWYHSVFVHCHDNQTWLPLLTLAILEFDHAGAIQSSITLTCVHINCCWACTALTLYRFFMNLIWLKLLSCQWYPAQWHDCSVLAGQVFGSVMQWSVCWSKEACHNKLFEVYTRSVWTGALSTGQSVALIVAHSVAPDKPVEYICWSRTLLSAFVQNTFPH